MRKILITGLAVLAWTSVAAAKPTRDQQAAAMEQKALRVYVSGDLPGAVRTIEQAVKHCESGCSAKTKAHLHVSLGTVRGVGQGDYGAAKKEFVIALGLDPDAKLRTMTTPELTQAFEEAKAASAPKPIDKPVEPPPSANPPADKTAEKPTEKPISVSDLFNQDEKAPPPPKRGDEKVAPPPKNPEDQARRNLFSVQALVDLPLLTGANVCAPGAPSGYYCTDENSEPHSANAVQKDDASSSGFAFSTARLLLGYERVLVAGFSAGAYVGVGVNSAPTATGRSKNASPLSAELRASYTFGDRPFTDVSATKLSPFVFGAIGVQDLDTHVLVRVNEIPCGNDLNKPACQRDLNAFMLSTGAYGTVGGGVRYRLGGPHALRGGLRATFMFGDGTLVFSPTVGYEFGI